MLFSLVLLLCGCTSKAQEDTQTGREKDWTEGIEEIPVFDGEPDFTYVLGTDCQTDLGEYSNVAYAETGVYQLTSRSYNGYLLYFTDNETGQMVPVCSKMNCTHEDTNCDAYFGSAEYLVPSLWFQDGSLFITKLEKDYICIEKVSPDGTKREKSCTLMRMVVETDDEGGSTEYFPAVQIHRGYAYFTLGVYPSETVTMYRVKLDSEEEAELLYTLQASENGQATMYRIKPYGRYVLFQMGFFKVVEESVQYTVSIYAYDTENGEITYFSGDVFRDFTLGEDALYYFDMQDNVYRKDFDAEDGVLIYENDPEETSDKNLLYFRDGVLVFEKTFYEMTTDKKTGMSYISEDIHQTLLNPDGSVAGIRDTEHDNLIIPY